MLKDDWQLNHVGLVVRDWHTALGYYQSTGMGVSVGPQIVDRDFAPRGPAKFYLNDKIPRISGGAGPGTATPPEENPAPRSNVYRFMDKDCQVGDLLLEILQDKRIPFEGISHLCFNVPDPAAETARLIDKGCDIVLSFTQDDGYVCENYIDTRRFGHVIVSFRPPVEQWEKIWTEHNLSHPIRNDWQFQGIGIAVQDLDEAVVYYESLGIADFAAEAALDIPDAGLRARTRTAQIGPVAYEFAQPLEGDSIYGDSLKSRGEGVCDMSFTVTDLALESSKLERQGVEALSSGEMPDGQPFAYFDTRKSSGNVAIRLIQND